MKRIGILLVVCLLGLTACRSGPPKNAAILRLHLPATPSTTEARRLPVTIRTPSMTIDVERFPVLSESDLDHVDLVGDGENYDMRLFFNTHGTITLDSVSTYNRGQIIVVMINGIPVAAPQLRKRIVDGVFEFTPDMSRAEAEKIVQGLTASIAYLNKMQGK